jgi:hypothetical protein
MMLPDAAPNPIPVSATDRILHLVDVENLTGGADFTQVEAAAVRQGYEAVAPTGIGDQVIIATSHHAAAAAWFAWPAEARRLVRSGTDGADLVLIAVLALERVEARFDRVVIGSGDGIFAFPAARLQAAGCQVTVITRGEALSLQLRLAVRDIRLIEREASSITAGGAA